MIEIGDITGFEIPTNPFPGLRPFEFNERLLYFGRDGQSEQLIRKLGAIRFVAVVGTSGSGKSSLVRAGLLPALFSGFMASAGSDWRIAVMRPGNDPLGNLALALNAPNVFGSEDDGHIRTAMTETALRRGSRGLIEVVRQARIASHESILVVVDQFEEIFRFARVAESEQYQNEAAAFVKLLLEAARQRELPIYVVLTMRSDFLGDCSLFWDLPEAINEGQYLIPRMTREQRREAITGPIGICGGEATPRLLTRLLNDMGNNPDQLPILQHALMRTWNKWKEGAGENGPIDLSHYEAIGTMANALSLHANEAYAELPDQRSRDYAEKIFKALTEKGADNREVRRPTELNDLCALAEAEESEVIAVIETFRREGRSFLMPPAGVPLHANSLIDISHESLIRNWKRLEQWVEEDSRSARIYRRLAETARLYNKREAGLYRDPDLQLALQWREQNRPNQIWAERYDADFGNAMKFLDESKAARDKEIEEKEALRKSRIKRNRIFVTVLAIAFVVSGALAIYALKQERIVKAQEQAANAKKKEVQQLLYAADLRTAHESFGLNSFPRAIELLDAHVDDELRGFDLYHLWSLLHRETATLKGHHKLVRSVAFSPDGRMIASSGGDNTIKLWDVASRTELATLQGHTNWVYSIAFSPDGKSLASASGDETIRLWDVASRTESATLRGHAGVIYSLGFSPDGKMLASAGHDHTIKLWKVDSPQNEPVTITGHTNAVYSVAFSPDGTLLASGSPGKPKNPGSTDDTRINTIKVWELASGKELEPPFNGHGKWVNCVAFSPDGRTLASGSDDGTVKLWDVASRKELIELEAHSNRVLSVTFSRDGKMLTGSCDDGTIKLWDVASRKELTTFKGHSDIIYSVAFSPDGKTLASGSDDSTVKLWDVAALNELYAPFQAHSDMVSSMAFSPNGDMLATSSSKDEAIKLWNVVSHEAAAPLSGKAGTVYSVAFSPDGKTLASAHGSNLIKLWDVASGKPPVLFKWQGEGFWVFSVAFSSDGKLLASGSTNGAVKLWDVASRKELDPPLSGHGKWIFSVAFSPDGKLLASGSDDSTVKLWDVASHQEVDPPLIGHSKSVRSVAFSPDGKLLASGSTDNTLKLWDVGSHKELATLKGHTNTVFSVAFSPDGKLLASGCLDGTVKLWSVPAFKELGTLKGHNGKGVRSVSFSRDGKTLASGDEDGKVILRHSATDEQVEDQRKRL